MDSLGETNKFNFDSVLKIVPENDSLYLAPEGINMHVSMPCPLKVPFKTLFSPFVEKWNRNSELKIHCPDINDCSSEDLLIMLIKAKTENDLPDIIVTSNPQILFSNKFYRNFLSTGIFRGINKASYIEAMPREIKDILNGNNLGVLCFTSWSLVEDLTVKDGKEEVRSWKDLVSPGNEGRLNVHGHIDRATFNIAYFITEKYGTSAFRQYAHNIADLKHFSQLIKKLCSSDVGKTKYTLLPDMAASKIPSGKKIEIVKMEDGKILSPMFLMVKESKKERCRSILEELWSEDFTKMLLLGGCILPDKMKKDTKYYLPDYGKIASDYEKISSELDKEYLESLSLDKIKANETPGGICGLH